LQKFAVHFFKTTKTEKTRARQMLGVRLRNHGPSERDWNDMQRMQKVRFSQSFVKLRCAGGVVEK
jgi:hypothetical protein